MLQKLNENLGFESRAALGRVLCGCEILPDDRISCGAFVSAAGPETGAAAPVLELSPGVVSPYVGAGQCLPWQLAA